MKEKIKKFIIKLDKKIDTKLKMLRINLVKAGEITTYDKKNTGCNYSSKFQIGHKVNIPYIKHIEGYSYNPNEIATIFDYINYFLWNFLGRVAYIFAWWLKDATRQYLHYLDGTGTVRTIDYSVAYKEDRIIRLCINSKIHQMVDFAQNEFYKGIGSKFEFTGGLEKFPNGNTENWQKTIGSHFVYSYGKVYFNFKTNIATMLVTIFAEDMYDFHPGCTDISSHIPDIINGRFAVLGWAKEFLTVGEIHLRVSWKFTDKDKKLSVKLCQSILEWRIQ